MKVGTPTSTDAMEVRAAKPVRLGRHLDRYFDYSRLRGTDPIVNHGNAYVTLGEMDKTVRSTLWQTKSISKRLRGPTLRDTLRNIWTVIYDHIAYQADSQLFEQLREPLRLFSDRKGDCDCYSIFASSVLTNLGLGHGLRMTKYTYFGRWSHVYVVVPVDGDLRSLDRDGGYITIDAVTDRFDYEVEFKGKHDHIMSMPIQRLNGLPARRDRCCGKKHGCGKGDGTDTSGTDLHTDTGTVPHLVAAPVAGDRSGPGWGTVLFVALGSAIIGSMLAPGTGTAGLSGGPSAALGEEKGRVVIDLRRNDK